MENNRGLLTHFSGIIRIVIIIIAIAILAFFVIRFMQNRQSTRTADQATQTTQEETQGANNDQAEERAGSGGVARDEENRDQNNSDESSVATVPGGVAESDVVPNTGPQAIPEAGTGEDILITGVLLSVSVFLFSKNKVAKNELALLQNR